MLKINDGTQIKRIAGKNGDRAPLSGVKRDRSVYVAVGGEKSINLSMLSPAIAYLPGLNQLTVRRSTKGGLISGLDYFEPSTSTITFPTALVAGEWVEIIKEVEVTGLVGLNPRPDMYTATGLAGQTLVTADFSWPYNMFPTKGQGACQVYLNGILQTRGTDYTEVNLNQANTNQIVFADALAGDENIIIRPSYQVIDQSAATSLFQGSQLSQMQSMVSAGTQGFVETSAKIAAPYTYINNRASIPDLTKDLRASLGVERIPVQSLFELQNEFGSNGEKVFAATNDDRGLIRFVGNWFSSTTTNGPYVVTSTANDYVEVTFYGTGLNVLVIFGPAALDIRSSVDNGTEGSNLWVAGASYTSTLQSRGYSPNQSINVASGLSLGLHTVRIRQVVAGAGFHGFEILNTDSSALVSVTSGNAYINSNKYSLANSSQFAHNIAATGTKGGRTVVYLKSDGTLGQLFQAVDPTQNTLNSTTHINEEVARTFYWREFGAGRSDDFSTLSGTSSSNRAFTLDDGTTTLTGTLINQGLAGGKDASGFGATNGFFAFTFIGTGVDLNVIASGVTGTGSLYIDGSLVTSSFTPSTSTQINKIASGLPYGTHTIKWVNNSYAGTIGLIGFTVYQPKKATVPQGTVELADYNVMANYSMSSSTILGATSSGILRKMGLREVTYVGTWQTPTIDAGQVGSFESGFNTITQVANSYAEYSFYGTGIEHYSIGNNAAQQWTISIDGATDLSAYTTGTVVASGSWSITPSTGVVSGTPSGKIRTYVRDLPLGWHKFRVTFNSGNSLYTDAYDIITPIHSYKSNLPGSYQNTAAVGGACVKDTRKTSMVSGIPTPQKAWAQSAGVTSSPTTTSSSFVPCPDMGVVINTTGNLIRVNYSIEWTSSVNLGQIAFSIYVDGLPAVGYANKFPQAQSAALEVVTSDSILIPVSPGFHLIQLYWYAATSGSTVTAQVQRRNLTVMEL